MNPYKDIFLLDPQVTFLNHGSFGAVPRPVFEVYQEWQRRLENQPVEFLGRRAAELLAAARQGLADYLRVEACDLVFFPNPTTALNMVARNFTRPETVADSEAAEHFRLRPGDEILTTDHEYGALNRTWRYICRLTGARYRTVPIPLPLDNADQFVERFWSQVSERTRWIFLSHITSPTALTFPVEQICARARQEGIPTIIDGAHAPGQIGLDLSALDADIYAGACHKWLCAPKGAAFLYVRRDLQPALDPLVVSWGYESEHPGDSRYVDYHEWQGTRDLAAFLSVPAAIEFQQRHDWEIVRSRCHSLAVQTRRRFEQVSWLPSICAEDQFQQMFTVRLPAAVDLDRLKAELYDHFKIEVPTISWNAEKFLRISIQVYNDEADADHLIQSIRSIL